MTEIRPQAAQERFLASPADIVIYGGAAGGGKTWGLLVEPLRHINNPAFRAVLFRRAYPQIINPGGMHDEAQKLYPLLGGAATQPSSGITWTFPSGAVVRFAHLQHDKTVYDWQGAQIPLIGFDELTHFSEQQFWYMLSRNRSLSGVRPYVRGTTNPEPNWVARLLDWWIGEDGYAIPERGGAVRWFVRFGGELVWANSADELTRKYRGVEPKSLTFIPARLEDNRVLMDRDPGYLANLLALPLVERERLLGGNWKIQPSGGKVFNRNWFEIVAPQDVPRGGVECRFWDLAATEKKLKGNDPDFTAGVKIRKVEDRYYVMDCIAVQAPPPEVDRLITATAQRDSEQARRSGTRHMIRWEIEPGSAGKRDTSRIVKMLDGYDARGERPTGDKLTRAKALSAQSEQGFVVLVAGVWNEGWLTHMHHQPDWDHDDIMDASSGAYNALANPGAESGFVDWYGEAPAPVIEPARDEGEIADALARYEAGLDGGN